MQQYIAIFTASPILIACTLKFHTSVMDNNIGEFIKSTGDRDLLLFSNLSIEKFIKRIVQYNGI